MTTYFVDWRQGDNGNSGKDPKKPLQTNQRALELSAEGDVVMVQIMSPPYKRHVVENGELKADQDG